MIMFPAYSIVILFIVLVIWFSLKKISEKNSLKAPGNVLLVTAHPDDECMFFAPTILALTREKRRNHIYLLCLSQGDYYGKGSVRTQELYRSSELLGILPNHITVVEDKNLPDSPNVEWNSDIINLYISKAVRVHHIQTIITFDLRGVSGHPNHTAISRAVRLYHEQTRTEVCVVTANVFLLETINLLRKYASVLDVPFSLLQSHCYTVISLQGYFKARMAMQAHHSQYVWFRKLYICFSRYMVINTLRELK